MGHCQGDCWTLGNWRPFSGGAYATRTEKRLGVSNENFAEHGTIGAVPVYAVKWLADRYITQGSNTPVRQDDGTLHAQGELSRGFAAVEPEGPLLLWPGQSKLVLYFF